MVPGKKIDVYTYELHLKSYDLEQNTKGNWKTLLTYTTSQERKTEPRIYFVQGLLYFVHDSFYNITDLPGSLLPSKVLRNGKVQLLDYVIPYMVYK